MRGTGSPDGAGRQTRPPRRAHPLHRRQGGALMSVEMVNHFLETPEYGKADPTGLLVLLYLAWRHTESQGCFPSLTTMEQHLHRPKASIWKAKKKLVQQGLLVVAHRGKGLAYTFPLYVHASTDAPRANAEDVKGSDRGVGTVQTG
ncbi:MAG TPA: hypothetical protein DDY72_04315, partial [Verrucomicrobia bacterium]|nr:hypothetical protein [Verrucomicrobiota bacterium]